MPEKARQALGKVGDFFKNMKRWMKIACAVGAVAIIALIVVLVVRHSNRPYAVLYSGLNQEDLQAVVNYLNNAGITDVKIRNNDTVEVYEEDADRLRALIAQQGYPSSGYGYGTYLDNINALSSQADRQQLALFELQERLASTIKWFDGVTNARVNITPGEDHRYILDDTVLEAKASIFVQMKNGKTLTKDQVAAIQRLVANAQQGLTIENVVVEDGAGNRYNSENSLSEVLDETAKFKLSLEEQVNEQVRNSIMNVLVPIVGLENVEVSVRSKVDVTRTYQESLVYHEPEWAADGSSGGKGIIGTQIWNNSLVRADDETAGGVVGTPNNTEINEYVTRETQVRGDEREIVNSGEIEYYVSKDNIQTEQPPGTITDVSVAIAINSAKINVQDPARFVHLAATAANIPAEVEAEKVAIVSYPFYQSGGGAGETGIGSVATLFGLPAWAVYAAIAGMALFMALLLVMLLLRSKKKKELAMLLAKEEAEAAAAAAKAEAEAAEAAAAAAAAAAAGQGADIMEVHTEEIMQVRKDVRKFVEENPSIAAQMLKNWLRGEET